MAKVTGREQVRSYLRQLPEQVERRLLRGAGRAAVEVVADEAKRRVRSDEVRGGIITSVRKRDDVIVARVSVKGQWENAVGTWLEYGTDGHFISVDPEQSGGRTAARVNKLSKEGTLVIAGNYVGTTVWHKGAKAYPFMRPALDATESEAIAAAQGYINSRIVRGQIVGEAE